MRMAELAKTSGVARETIHFYLREGLLPRPEKGGRTVAYYGDEHLARLRTIRRLREEKYLPLAVIRRLLESPAATAERDVGLLADVLHLISPGDELGPAPSSDALAEAQRRRLLGPATRHDGARGRRGAGHAAAQTAASDGAQAAASPAPAERAQRTTSRPPPPMKVARSAAGDPAERRVLGVIEEALALEGTARRLTLDDLEVCASSLTTLVAREASLVFDAMFESADIGDAIAALRAGRPAVAHFIAAYRDLMLRRVV